MTVEVLRLSGATAYDLIYPDYLSMLPINDQSAMQQSMLNSARVWVGLDGEKVLCCLGLVPPTLLSDRAYLWLYTTEHLQHHVFIFVRHSQRLVAQMLTEYPIIVGHTLVSNTKAIRWLRWLGAEFGAPIDGVAPFEIRAPQ